MTTLSLALEDLLNRGDALPLDEALDAHFAADYRQRTNGEWDDRAGFRDHIAHLRSIVQSIRLTVLEELDAPPLYAERHVVEIRKRDGTHVTQEVYAFGERAGDGRFSRIEETTLMLHGAEADRRIGTAR